jgi:hypothetical protein
MNMGYLIMLLCVLALTAIAIVVTAIFGYQKNVTMRKLIAFGLCASLLLSGFAIVFGGIVANTADELTATYNDLILYQTTVEQSTNEYVRYDYYDKVVAYNEAFADYVIASQDKWLGGLYPANWDEGIALIDFQLHGDNYYGD